MKKIIQLMIIAALVSASNSYAWEWPNWRSWFAAPTPGPNYKELTVKGDITTPYKSYIKLPSDVVKHGESYEILKIGNKYYMKITPTKKYVSKPFASEPSAIEKMPEYRAKALSKGGKVNIEYTAKDIQPSRKAYITPFTGGGKKIHSMQLRSFVPKPKTSEAEKILERTQRMTE